MCLGADNKACITAVCSGAAALLPLLSVRVSAAQRHNHSLALQLSLQLNERLMMVREQHGLQTSTPQTCTGLGRPANEPMKGAAAAATESAARLAGTARWRQLPSQMLSGTEDIKWFRTRLDASHDARVAAHF